MFQNSRLNELLKYFLAHREYTPSSKLTGHFQISERTLRGDVRAVNDELKKYHAQISVKRREGYYLHLEDPSIAAFLEESVKTRDSQLDSVDKRINHLIIKMLYLPRRFFTSAIISSIISRQVSSFFIKPAICPAITVPASMSPS